MPESESCVICQAGFRVGMLKDGKCPVCLKEHPLASSREEITNNDVMKEKENRGHIQNIVDERIITLLTKWNIIGECKCGERFFMTSPNRRYCENCSQARYAKTSKINRSLLEGTD